MSEIRSQVQKQAQNTLLQYAIFRWESAVVVALTLVLFFLVPGPLGLPSAVWLLLGLVALVVVIYMSLTDAETNARVLVDLYQERFDVRKLENRDLRKEVEEGLEYQRRIETQIRRQRPGVLRDRLEDTANQLTEWVGNIYQLALRLDAYLADDLLRREHAELPADLQDLRNQRQRTANPDVQRQLDQVIAAKTQQWQTLSQLDDRMQQADLQMKQSLTALATVYSQVQLIDAESIQSGRAERLQADIQEQVVRMNELVVSINEVYGARE